MRLKLGLLALGLFVIWNVLAYSQNESAAEPDYLLAQKYGCKVTESYTDDDYWLVDVWITFSDDEPKYVKLESVRKNEEQALADCASWMRDVRKKIERAQGKRRK